MKREGRKRTNLAQELLRLVGLSEDEVLGELDLDSSIGSSGKGLPGVERGRRGSEEDTGGHFGG